MSAPHWIEYPSDGNPGKFSCGCGVRLHIPWAPGADFSCPSCGAEYNSGGQRLATRDQWGEETGEHPTDIENAIPSQEGIVIAVNEDPAMRACRALVEAYQRGLNNAGSIEWEDMDEAHRLACEAVRMAEDAEPKLHKPDPAAIWYAANSLLQKLKSLPKDQQEAAIGHRGGEDNWMREFAIPAAAGFEDWACRNVSFDDFEDMWCYWLEEFFGKLHYIGSDIGKTGDELHRFIAMEGKLPLLTCAGSTSLSAP